MSFHKHIQIDFQQAGARARLRPLTDHSSSGVQSPMAIDIAEDKTGEYFDIQLSSKVALAAVDIRPHDRHLLLSAWNWLGEDRFLCGHDEFHWFVAALPVEPYAKTVNEAKEALKPDMVKRLERRKHQGKSYRRNDVYMRQGEWFFMPCRHASIDLRDVIRDGELLRGKGSKPHRCDYLYEDGEKEYECKRFPKLAFFESEYRHLLRTRRKAKQWKWRQLPFNPDIYVKGWIRHIDHSPLFLDVWHRVKMNRETDDLSMSRMIYRD